MTKQSHAGFSGKARLALEFIVAGIACYFLMKVGGDNMSKIAIPMVKGYIGSLGTFFIVFGGFVIVAAGNCVNLTDGLDGLAIVPSMIAVGDFAIIAYLVGNAIFSNYLGINHVAGVGELTIICSALIGAGLGFLWFNAPPAHDLHGRHGLAGARRPARHDRGGDEAGIRAAVVGGFFVLEGALGHHPGRLSFKGPAKRIFLMAPLHHHFEQKGWKEPQIVIRFWIIAFVLALIGLSSLTLKPNNVTC